jgi:hypothetical protein
MEQRAQQQARGARADDHDLMAHGARNSRIMPGPTDVSSAQALRARGFDPPGGQALAPRQTRHAA